ncbi:hypothetical protein LYNGBM3L_32520 [Moorena producens 3L]|uniref:Uncharacterized protein n=1 Tax=Moorena producens 3L TaxID=489825 RepID=F4XPE7_9CYAN|nr:hypothetical protein LYNGBM3L_32520 [Moorena producens 3L]OLT53509.1 hypothetical protein BI334_33175 [Moorena producens 3L]
MRYVEYHSISEFILWFTTALRDITVTTEDETGMQIAKVIISESSAWRYGFFLSVDLPLLNLGEESDENTSIDMNDVF